MSRFDRVWAGEREPRLRAMPAGTASRDEAPVVAAFRAFTAQLIAGTGAPPTPRSIDLRKLRLTEGFREALRQDPRERTALFAVWDEAYRVLERRHWELAPPAIDPPPPASFEELERSYEAAKRERDRQAEARTTHWHPLEIDNDLASPTRPDAAE